MANSANADPYADLGAVVETDPYHGVGEMVQPSHPTYETELTKPEEQRFQEWKAVTAPNDSGADYDLRGAFKAGLAPGTDGHWPDTFKKPNHPTFSVESIYAADRPDLAGKWEGDSFVPAADPYAGLGEPVPAAPTSNAAVDVAKRIGRGALAGVGYIAEAGSRLSNAIGSALPAFMTDERFQTEEHPLTTAGNALQAVAAKIPVDPARDAELKSAIAEGAGAAVPVLAASALNPVLGVTALAGQMGEAERAAALAKGDTPELAGEKAKLARLGGAVMGVLPVGPVRGGAGVVERLATRSATGAAVNAAQEAGMEQIIDQKIDWGRVRSAGAFGAGLGLVIGVPEAIALRKAFPGAASHEGKTLGQAVDAISGETGLAPTEVQQRINEAVGVKPPLDGEARAARAAEAESALGERATADQAATNQTTADAAQNASLFESRLKRQADVESALSEQDRLLQEQITRRQAGLEQSPQSIAWLLEGNAGRQAEAGITSLDARLGRGEGATGERTRMTQQLPSDSPLLPSKPDRAADRIGPRLSSQAQRMSDQYGAIDPALLLPVARAAAGGALGYATGDTPEERVRNALLGMGFGAVASPALAKRLTAQVLSSPSTKAAQELFRTKANVLRLKVAPQSLLPRDIRTQLRWGEQASTAITNQGLSLTRDLEKAIGGLGNAPVKAAAAVQVKDFLDGSIPAAALPAPLRVSAQKVRDYVDQLTDRAVAEGVVSGKMAQTFLTNRGSYLRRSYEIFLNPDYKPAPAVVSAAIKAISQAQGVGTAEAEGIVAGILDKNGRNGLPDFLLGRGKVAGKDVSSLVQRKDLLPEVRTLLGEIKDPILATNQTIPRMARLIENDAAQRQVRAIGSKLGLFSDVRSLERPTPVVSDGSATHDVLAGLYAAPEIAAALQKEAGSGRTAFVPEMLWKTLTTASSAAKMSKTVLNPESYAPNVVGGIIANIANANFRYNHTARGLALGAEELGVLRQFVPASPGREALRKELTELQKLGVIGESVNSQDLLRTLESSFFGALRDRTKSVLSIPSKVYGSVDDFNRYIAWQSERARYAKAFPSMAAEELKRRAAEVVRATTPVYSEVPKLVKQLSVAGIAPSFVNFAWEVFRNTKNSVAIGLRDLQEGRSTGNAGLVRAGAERLAAITAVVSAASMWGVSKLSRDSNGITDEKDAAIRYFSPKWNRDGVLQYLSPAEAGKPVQYSNLSYLVPHALLFQAIEAGRRGADEGRAIPEFLRALNEQFGFGQSVLIPPVAGAIQGFDPKTGRSIPKTEVEPTFLDRAKYLGDQAFKPLVADWIEKFNKARFGEKGAFGRVYTVSEQLQRLVGIRSQTLDPIQAVQWKARDVGAKFQDATDLYRLQLKQQATPEKLNQFYEYAQQGRRAQFDDMGAMIKNARALGVPDDQIIGAMRAGHVPPNVILNALDGRYPDLEREGRKTGAEYLAELQARPERERGAALAQIYREDPAMAKSVLSLVKTAAKGRTEYDKAVLGLSVGDGARADYLRSKLSNLPTAEQRRAFLIDLQRKGILTSEVMRQMATPAK